MLRIRLTRTGKRSQESFRIVVAEHKSAVKGKYLELLGHYKPATQPKQLVFQKERVQHWITKGAQPSASVAALLKRNGMEGMDKFVVKTTRTAKKKKGGSEAPQAPAAA